MVWLRNGNYDRQFYFSVLPKHIHRRPSATGCFDATARTVNYCDAHAHFPTFLSSRHFHKHYGTLFGCRAWSPSIKILVCVLFSIDLYLNLVGTCRRKLPMFSFNTQHTQTHTHIRHVMAWHYIIPQTADRRSQ